MPEAIGIPKPPYPMGIPTNGRLAPKAIGGPPLPAPPHPITDARGRGPPPPQPPPTTAAEGNGAILPQPPPAHPLPMPRDEAIKLFWCAEKNFDEQQDDEEKELKEDDEHEEEQHCFCSAQHC